MSCMSNDMIDNNLLRCLKMHSKGTCTPNSKQAYVLHPLAKFELMSSLEMIKVCQHFMDLRKKIYTISKHDFQEGKR